MSCIEPNAATATAGNSEMAALQRRIGCMVEGLDDESVQQFRLSQEDLDVLQAQEELKVAESPTSEERFAEEVWGHAGTTA